MPEETEDFGNRVDGTKKGMGFFGKIPRKDGKGFSTELTVSSEVDGKTLHHPLLVPGLTHKEIHDLVNGGPITKEVYQKSIDHAINRLKTGKSVYAEPDERHPLPPSEEEDMEFGFRGDKQ